MPHVWELSPGRRKSQIQDSLYCWKELFPETVGAPEAAKANTGG
jgi:hypothetical protein